MPSLVKKPEGYEHYRTTGELALYLGVTRKTILRWSADKHIHASMTMQNGTRLFSPEDCQKALEYRRIGLSSERARQRRIT